MSKTLDDLIAIYDAARKGAPIMDDMRRAGIAAVIRALAPDDDEIAAYNRLSYKVQEQLKCECEYLPEDRCIRCSVVDALKCLETRYEILGDAGTATAGAIQPQGEAQNGFRRSIEGPEGGATSGAFGLERQGNVPVPGERINLHREPPTAAGNIPRRDSDRLPAPHRHEDGRQQVRALVGVTDGPAGRGLGDSSLNEKVAGGPTREDERATDAGFDSLPADVGPSTPAAPAPTVGQRLIKAAHEAAAIARVDMQPGRVHAASASVCEWKLSNEVGALGFRWLAEPIACGASLAHEGYAKALNMRCLCGLPIALKPEAQR